MNIRTTAATHPQTDPELRAHYLRLISDGDEYAAIELVTGLLDDGLPALQIMIDLIGRTQGRAPRAP